MEHAERLKLIPPEQSVTERANHWLRDGGARHVFDSFFWALSAFAICAFCLIAIISTAVHKLPQPPSSAHVIDHRKDGTATPRKANERNHTQPLDHSSHAANQASGQAP